jgi:hypothetical protein
MGHRSRTADGWRRIARALGVTTMLGTLVGVPAAGCLDRPIEPIEPRTTSEVVERLSQLSVNKVDILLVIDNSRSMKDKQEILRVAVPDLVEQLVRPQCVDREGRPLPDQPANPTDPCPVACDGRECQREFDPILDMHIGVITSSLGGHGGDVCTGEDENERAHLIHRVSPASETNDLPTWQDSGFLVWDPDSAHPSPTSRSSKAT